MLPYYRVVDSDGLWSMRLWRAAWGVTGAVLLVFVRPRAGRWGATHTAGDAFSSCAPFAVAIVLALGVSELVMRRLDLPSTKGEQLGAMEVKIGQPDSRFGWTYAASKSTVIPTGTEKIPTTYAINAQGNRAPTIDDLPDPDPPTVIFAGESITAGHGLPFDATYPALVGADLGLQVVDLGVHGYGSDQAYLRTIDALPHFSRVVAVVTLFFEPMLERMTHATHPRFVLDGDRLQLTPADESLGFFSRLRLVRVWRNLVPYHDDTTLDVARAIMRSTAEAARARGAYPLFVQPWTGDEPSPHADQWLLDALFAEQGIPYAVASIGSGHIPGDIHPDAEATRRLADVVVAALHAGAVGR